MAANLNMHLNAKHLDAGFFSGLRAPGLARPRIQGPAGSAPEAIPDWRTLFESVPGLFLVLRPDAPRFTVVAASNAYLRATMAKREEIVGRGFFDWSPADQSNSEGTDPWNVRASIARAIRTRKADAMPIKNVAFDTPRTTVAT